MNRHGPSHHCCSCTRAAVIGAKRARPNLCVTEPALRLKDRAARVARALDTTTRHQRTILRAGIIMCAASGHSVTRGARGYADAWGARCARESLGRPYDDRNHRRTPSASIRVDAWGLIASAPDPKVVQPFRSARQSRVPCIIYFSDPRWADAVGLCCYQRVVWLPLSGA
jgi:hypothetical protein